MTNAQDVAILVRMSEKTPTPIQHRRINAGLTQEQLAEAIGMRRNNLSTIENGKWIPGIKICARIANAIGCTIDEVASDLGVRVA